MSSYLFKKFISNIPEKVKKLTMKQNDIAEQIYSIIENTEGINQKILAEKMGKTESYISRVLGGGVNMTLKTIVEFEHALDENILVVPMLNKDAIGISDTESEKSLSVDSNFAQVYGGNILSIIYDTIIDLSLEDKEEKDDLKNVTPPTVTSYTEVNSAQNYGNIAYA